MLKMLRNMLVGLSVLLMAVFASAATITIDGDMTDWTSAMMLDVAPGVAEETGDFDFESLDIKDFYMTNDADYVYVRIDINENGVYSDVADGTVPGVVQFFFDSDMSTETGLTWDWWATGCDYWLRPLAANGDTVLHYIGVGGSSEDYEEVGNGYALAFNADDNAFEAAIPRADVGLDAIDASCSILVLFEETTNWDADGYPDDLGGATVDYYFSSTKIIDGDMSDWVASEMIDGAATPEETGDFDFESLDMKDLYLAYDDDYVYVRIDINENGVYGDVVDGTVPGVVQFFFDTDLSTETGLTWDWWATGCDYWLRPLDADGDTLLHYIGVGGSSEDYEEVGNGYAVAFNDDDNAFECAIPRADIGEIGTFYESFYFLALFEETTNWDADAFPDDIGGTTALYSFGAGGTQRTAPVTIDEEISSIPSAFAILGNYPNPFNPSTTIRFTLDVASSVNLDVYNMLGQKVASVYSGPGQAGSNEVTWNGTNDFNQSVDSGVYLYRISTPVGAVSGKMIMLK